MEVSAPYINQIAQEYSLQPRQVLAAAQLLAEGSTVPFIARYRKEATDSLDEVAIAAIRDRMDQLKELDARRDTILRTIEEQGKLTDELRAAIAQAATLSKLEDIYLPYKPKRRTRGMIAKEKGLEPLAVKLLEQADGCDVDAAAGDFVNAGKEVASVEEALAGARDIIAEWVNENADARSEIRELFAEQATIKSKVLPGKETEGQKYKDYFDWEELLRTAPSHRILAIRRAAAEGIVGFRIQPPEDIALRKLERRFVTSGNPAAEQVRLAVRDSYKRLMSLSIETDLRLEAKLRADAEAIRVFVENLRELLLAAPLGQKSLLAIDPGLRTGCKVVCLDRQGKLLCDDVIYPLAPHNKTREAEAKLRLYIEKYNLESIAIGNGTGGRETEVFCRSAELGRKIPVIMVNESGASVYSASEVAREEFPEYDLTVRGAVSIGRRLADPLAELVKIDPKSIGVGQYQHDVDQNLLKKSLDDTVISCVNAVGVEVNTASKQLLSYVSGLSERLAGNIITYRNEHGAFTARHRLLKVPGMGPKTFEQAAGFLRIRDGENPLDASAVHPENYGLVEQMAADAKCSVAELIRDPQRRTAIRLEKYMTDTVGLPTLTDILGELAKPGRDPREKFEPFQFAEGVNQITDLQPGMKLPGIVTNVAAFGAFVDIGVHQDGLVHISELSDTFVRNPADVVKVQQKVHVTVMEVDVERRRISLSMKSQPGSRPAPKSGEQASARKPAPTRQATPKKQPPPKADSNNPFVDFFKNFPTDRK